MNKINFPGFQECLKLIKSKNPMEFEDGFHLLLPHVREFGEAIVELIKIETDPKIQSRLVELLGECEDEKYKSIFESLLTSKDHDVVAWSLTSLEKLSSGKKTAREFRASNPKWLE